MKSEVKCKITDLLEDYVVLHERIKALYTMLEVHGYIHWYWLESNHAKKKNYWENYYDIVKNTIAIDVKTFDPIKCKEDMENTSVRNNNIREIKDEIKRYHRLQPLNEEGNMVIVDKDDEKHEHCVRLIIDSDKQSHEIPNRIIFCKGAV